MGDRRLRVDPLPPDEPFRFTCHPGVACFGDCCSDLQLMLHPYDVLRLRQALGQASDHFLEHHADIEAAPGSGFPQVSLRMREGGDRPCPFVREGACTVYEDRPGACRSYPVGRGAQLDEDGRVQVEHLLVREDHCRGFDAGETWTAERWLADQRVAEYLRSNDRHLRLVARWLKEREVLGPGPRRLVTLALYRPDVLGERIRDGRWPDGEPLPEGQEAAILEDEAARLHHAFDWVESVLVRGR